MPGKKRTSKNKNGGKHRHSWTTPTKYKDHWHVVMPDGSTAGPFNAKHQARERADMDRQKAQADPAYLKSFGQKEIVV